MLRPSSFALIAGLATLALAACTTQSETRTASSATRTSDVVYPPTNAQLVQILWEDPSRPFSVHPGDGVVGNKHTGALPPFEIVGKVESQVVFDPHFDMAIYWAMMEKAAELGANAILLQEDPVDFSDGRQRAKALALRWTDAPGGGGYAGTPDGCRICNSPEQCPSH